MRNISDNPNVWVYIRIILSDNCDNRYGFFLLGNCKRTPNLMRFRIILSGNWSCKPYLVQQCVMHTVSRIMQFC